MATSLVNTGLQFPDGTIQTTAGLTSVVKSVQRGTGSVPGNSTSLSVTISAVNREKSMVIINGVNALGSSSDAARLNSFPNDTSFTIIGITSSSWSTYFSWQVIEFY